MFRFDENFLSNLFKFNSWKKWAFGLTLVAVYLLIISVLQINGPWLGPLGVLAFLFGAALSGDLDKNAVTRVVVTEPMKQPPNPLSKKCTFCGSISRADVQVCRDCGTGEFGNLSLEEISRINTESPNTKKCDFCAEDIRVEARKCRFCGEFLSD